MADCRDHCQSGGAGGLSRRNPDPVRDIFIPGAVVTYVYPYIASHNRDRAWLGDYFKKLYIAMGAVNLLISIGLYITGSLIFRILFPKYMSAIPVFLVLVVGYFF